MVYSLQRKWWGYCKWLFRYLNNEQVGRTIWKTTWTIKQGGSMKLNQIVGIAKLFSDRKIPVDVEKFLVWNLSNFSYFHANQDGHLINLKKMQSLDE